MRLFQCDGCKAKEEEIGRLHERIAWFEKQVDQQNRRLLELADPAANQRLVQADRLEKRPISAPRAAPASPVLPGTEPSPPPTWEIDVEGA